MGDHCAIGRFGIDSGHVRQPSPAAEKGGGEQTFDHLQSDGITRQERLSAKSRSWPFTT
jgi:hypothetical protein